MTTATTALICPESVYTKTPAPHLSSRYHHVNSMDVLKALKSDGMEFISAKADKARARNPAFVRHMIQFGYPKESSEALGELGLHPRILFTNSHNGRTAAILRLGLYRFVCANGLVVGSDFAVSRVVHSSNLALEVIESARRFSAAGSRIIERVSAMSRKELTRAKAIEFAEKAMEVRFPGSRGRYDVESVLTPQRAEDEGRSVWAVYNTLQERLMRGGLQGVSANGRRIRSRSLTGINADIGFNSELWNMAEGFAGIKE